MLNHLMSFHGKFILCSGQHLVTLHYRKGGREEWDTTHHKANPCQLLKVPPIPCLPPPQVRSACGHVQRLLVTPRCPWLHCPCLIGCGINHSKTHSVTRIQQGHWKLHEIPATFLWAVSFHTPLPPIAGGSAMHPSRTGRLCANDLPGSSVGSGGCQTCSWGCSPERFPRTSFAHPKPHTFHHTGRPKCL